MFIRLVYRNGSSESTRHSRETLLNIDKSNWAVRIGALRGFTGFDNHYYCDFSPVGGKVAAPEAAIRSEQEVPGKGAEPLGVFGNENLQSSVFTLRF